MAISRILVLVIGLTLDVLLDIHANNFTHCLANFIFCTVAKQGVGCIIGSNKIRLGAGYIIIGLHRKSCCEQAFGSTI
jgi:hypothetical protein